MNSVEIHSYYEPLRYSEDDVDDTSIELDNVVECVQRLGSPTIEVVQWGSGFYRVLNGFYELQAAEKLKLKPYIYIWGPKEIISMRNFGWYQSHEEPGGDRHQAGLVASWLYDNDFDFHSSAPDLYPYHLERKVYKATILGPSKTKTGRVLVEIE